MKAVLQRVESASVEVDGQIVGQITNGLLILVGVCEGDQEQDLQWLSRKIVTTRVFEDKAGKMSHSVLDVGGSVLFVSQFTVCAEVRKGTRPSFAHAMEPVGAQTMFEDLVASVAHHVPVQTGRFQTHMRVSLCNDGPVTLWLNSRRSEKAV